MWNELLEECRSALARDAFDAELKE